ncbi:polyketide cyclase [Enterococcus malodoratus]|uniref:polyketide cyclase n=1 Tax=Enterococcus malodoratus TaxID=71451 RepID=UPI0039B03AAE
MTTTKIEAIFDVAVEPIWEIVTSLNDVKWRSDLSRIEVLKDQKNFIEYTKQGIATRFTITEFKPLMFYAFSMDNDSISGKWTGEFFYLGKHKTRIIFKEEVTAKKIYMKPFVKGYLIKQQKTYIRDLTNYLSRL